QELSQIGAHRDDQTCIISHSGEAPSLQIGRQTTISWAGITAMQRLPGEIIAVIGMPIDQAQQAREQYLVKRRIPFEQRALLRWNVEAKQHGGHSRQKTRRSGPKQSAQTLQRLDPLRRVDFSGQQCGKIDSCEPCHEMRKSDETATHAVTIETV